MHDLFIEGLRIHQYLETYPDGAQLVEADWLFFPELKTLGSNPGSVHRAQERLLLKLLTESDPDELSRRIAPDSEIAEGRITLTMDSPVDVPLWGAPLELQIAYLSWREDKLRMAFVPGLGIEIPLPKGADADEVLEDQIRFAISRRRINRHLFDLSLLQRVTRLDIEKFRWNAYPLSPTERVMKEEGDEKARVDVLSEVGTRIDNRAAAEVYERQLLLEQIASLLKSKRGSTSILLVGESGVGKTAIIQQFSRQQENLELRPKEVYHVPGSKIVAGMSGFGEWQDRCRKMAVEATSGMGKILYFGNLMELLEVGQSASSSESVASFFRPWLVRGQFIAIAECTPAQLSQIEQKDPRIMGAFRQIPVAPPDRKTSIKILQQVASELRRHAEISQPALQRIFGLHDRYAGYSAMPGKMLHFTRRLVELEAAQKQEGGSTRITPARVNRTFALETGLPGFLLDEAVQMDADEVRIWFGKRIKGQSAALDLVVDTISMIKARLTRPHRPLASFLFVGPTGVGKTELAKTLAEFFYGSPERLVRIDMSEYSAPGSSVRLASGGPGEPEGILTSKLRDQPFSVVLLDEFEKADASVYDLFLQVLGEARLTDGAGRLADFSNAVVILTSNLGAADFRAVAPGFGDPDRGQQDLAIDHFVAAAKKRFRPEFFNRIGKIVPFLPLDSASIEQVIERELQKLDHRDGLRNREITLFVDNSVAENLVKTAFDPRYGARPLKRKIEEVVIQPISQFLVASHHIDSGTLHGSIDETGVLKLRFQAESDSRSSREKSSIARWKERIPNMRRWYQLLAGSHLVSELHSETRRLERRVKHKPGPRDHERLAHCLAMLEKVSQDLEILRQTEETLLLAEYRNASFASVEPGIREAPQWPVFCDLLREVYLWVQRSSSRVVLVFVGDDRKRLCQVLAAYREVGLELNCRADLGYFRKDPQSEDLDPGREGHRKAVLLVSEDEVRSVLKGELPGNCAAVALQLSGKQVALRFALESGMHRFLDREGDRQHVNITCFDDESFQLGSSSVSEAVILNREFGSSSVRRFWDEKEKLMRDEKWGSSADSDKIDPRDLPSEFSAESVFSLIELTLIDNALEAIR